MNLARLVALEKGMVVMFADLAPDRAEAARQMGREIGLSRAICATNWPSDVQAGAALGEAVFAAQGVAPLRDEDLRPFSGLASLAERLKSGQKDAE